MFNQQQMHIFLETFKIQHNLNRRMRKKIMIHEEKDSNVIPFPGVQGHLIGLDQLLPSENYDH